MITAMPVSRFLVRATLRIFLVMSASAGFCDAIADI
jgi:hypothetical protein